jgi:4,5-DOPA dioxygenase extradiol
MKEMTSPALFVAHGAPSLALDDDTYTRALAAYGAKLEGSMAAVVVSAHWEAAAPVRVNAEARPKTVHDFGGFPEELYRLTYPAPGSPQLANEIASVLQAAGVPAVLEEARGWDHGLWVPLRLMLPEARIPIVELSLPVPRTPRSLEALGAALSPLRARGVAILGTGGIVHNLATVRLSDKAQPALRWAVAFDAWVRGRLEAGDYDALLEYRQRAPHAALAVPTPEHIDPFFVVLGARREGDRLVTLFEGFQYGTLSMRGVAFESPA